jgi:FtsH-binding integral membrane protein
MLGLVCMFSSSPFLNNLLCALGVIIFGIYIIIDTQMIIGSHKYGIGMDDYILGALILYIDIIQLFLYILRLLSKNR